MDDLFDNLTVQVRKGVPEGFILTGLQFEDHGLEPVDPNSSLRGPASRSPEVGYSF